MVKEHREKHGLNRCLAALGVSKSTWHRHQRAKVSRKDEELKAKVFQVVEEHPAYGSAGSRWNLRRATGPW